MKYGLVAILAVFFVSGLALCGQSPDEKYVTIYNLIQEGDGFLSRKDLVKAAERYQQAQSLLKEFPVQYPHWNEGVVGFRLRYLGEKLAELAPDVPAATPTNAASQVAAAPGPAVLPPSDALRELQGEIARLAQHNADLEAKLKEALKVQPAPVDPRELARAEQKIQELQKEIDLLRVTLDQERTKAVRAGDTTAAAQEQVLIADFKDKLRRQNELVASLQQENDNLKTQLELTKTLLAVPGDPQSAAQDLLVAQATIAGLQATNIALKTERIVLESRLEEMRREAAASTAPQLQELMRQRDELNEKLTVALKQLERLRSRPETLSNDDVARQLEAALAKLDVYQAKAVPYSPEELALFKQAATNTLATNPKAAQLQATAPVNPPAGTGPTMELALKANLQQRFEDAERLFREVLQRDTNHVFTLNYLASVQLKQDNLAGAEQTIRHALRVEPGNPDTLFLWGQLQYLQGQYDEALEFLGRAARGNTNDFVAQYYLAQTLIQKGDRQAAETALRKALQLNPNWAEAHYALARVYADQQPPFKELAQWHYNKALDNKHAADPELEARLSGNPSPP